MLDQNISPANPADYLAPTAQTIGQMFLERVGKSGKRTAWRNKKDGVWQPTTWNRFHEHAAAVFDYVAREGLEIDDKVCVIGSTRPEWGIVDIGCLLAGCVTVVAYPTLAPAQLAYLLDHSDTKIVFAEGKADVDKLLSIRSEIPDVQRVVVWDTGELETEMENSDWLVAFDEVLTTQADGEAIKAAQAKINPESTAIIVYTSGTTGPPKGAMISHSNILALLTSAHEFLPTDADDHSFSFLPMAHVAERIGSFYGRISAGISTAYATSIAHVLNEVVEVKPTIFFGVPRIFEKAYAKMMAGVEEASPAKQRMFRWAERQGRDVVQYWQADKPIPFELKLKYKLADKLVFSKIRSVFGGQVRQFLTSAAPIAYEILEFFWAAGCPIREAYGQTEATMMTHGNRAGAVRLGSVGKPVGGTECKLAEDGEILVRGPLVFQGYYKNPEATADTVDDEGWLHTGDIGKVDDDGFYYIVDRKKHIIITAGGKNLTPANIENELKAQDPLISQIHVHGDKRPFISAIVTVAAPEAIEYAVHNNSLPEGADTETMQAELIENPLADPPGLNETMKAVTSDPTVQNRIKAAIAKGNANLTKVETVKRFHILERDFSVEAEELTPTLKVKRKNVEQKYADVFDKLYDDNNFGIAV